MSGKRKPDPTPTLRYDEKLTTATRAFKNLTTTRVDDRDELTSGAFDAFPLPSVRLRGAAADLPLPLTLQAVDTIIPNAATANPEMKDSTGEIPAQELEVRNPRWRAFVDKIACDVREPLGICQEARVHATLTKLVLVQPGGHLPVDHKQDCVAAPRRGVFGTLVIVLPGEFTGGATTIRRDAETAKPPLQWQPADRQVFDVTYAALFNDIATLETLPVTSGEALCLVYDLVTTTVHEVPRCASPAVLEHAFQSSLSQFFEVLPSHKRFKISDDAWRTINEFVVDRRFVFPVTGDSFDALQGNDQRIAERLATFCAQTQGQFVLYIAALSCARQSYVTDGSADETSCSVSLSSPWFKHGELRELPFPPMVVKHRTELAPVGFLEALPFERNDNLDDASDSNDSDDSSDSDDSLHRYRHEWESPCDNSDGCYKTQRYDGYALVVQPATLEHALWAKAPIRDAVEKLWELVEPCPEEAVRFARRVLSHQRYWASTDDTFAQFRVIVVALKDARLFNDLLRSVTSFEYEDHVVSRGVRHFGWESSVATIEYILKPRTPLRSRVNLVCSLLHDSANSDHIDRLVHKFAGRLPWSGYGGNAEYADHPYYDYLRRDNPTVDELVRLLALAYRSSVATLAIFIGEPTAGNATIHLLVPSLVRFAGELSSADRAPLHPVLRSLCATIEASLPVLRNAHYAQNAIHEFHCARCREIRSFLVSTEMQTSIAVSNKTQVKHVETVIKRKMLNAALVTVSSTSTAVQLTKVGVGNAYSETVEQALAPLASLIP